MAETIRKKKAIFIKKPRRVVQRNIALLGELMRYLLAYPKLFRSLPDGFELVILPEDDPEMRRYNLELLDVYGSKGKPVVFARIKSSRTADLRKTSPSLYVPLSACSVVFVGCALRTGCNSLAFPLVRAAYVTLNRRRAQDTDKNHWSTGQPVTTTDETPLVQNGDQ